MTSKPDFRAGTRRLARIAIAACAISVIAASGVLAKVKETVLHSFSGSDGGVPYGLMLDPSGTLYGTTNVGGTQNDGVVFALTPNGTAYDFSVIYNFCSVANCTDGILPLGQPLIEDTSGDLYGVTYSGGDFNGGTAFELIPKNGSWSLVTLYSFCKKTACADGQSPVGGLTYLGAQSGAPYDGTSPLYGATYNGGSSFDSGVAYELDFQGKTARSEKVLHTFCKVSGCSDGAHPDNALTIDAKGHLYGMTLQGGSQTSGSGVVYKLTFNTTKNRWKYGIYYEFCANGGSCPDGRVPGGTLFLGSKGHLFGVTQEGGDFANGVVFELTPAGKAATETALYSFCADQNTCTDGSLPLAGVILDSKGNIFGVTSSGGFGFDEGVAFELSGGTETVLYDFCKLNGCTDGRVPQGNIIRDSSGNIFGVTQTGGNVGAGVVFEITGTP
jgi:uncharacterized repeat protein (TIGR03803 family)